MPKNVSRNHACSHVRRLNTCETAGKLPLACNVARIEMQHLYATARRRFLRRGVRGCCEFRALYHYRETSGSSLSFYRDAGVSRFSRLNQNSQDVTKTDALSGALRGIAKRNGEYKGLIVLSFANFVKSLERILYCLTVLNADCLALYLVSLGRISGTVFCFI